MSRYHNRYMKAITYLLENIYFYAIFMHFNLRNAVLLFSICRNIDYIFK